MYRILDSKGKTIAVTSRRKDAEALAQKSLNEPQKKVDKVTD
jgi:hypothetical protein